MSTVGQGARPVGRGVARALAHRQKQLTPGLGLGGKHSPSSQEQSQPCLTYTVYPVKLSFQNPGVTQTQGLHPRATESF